MVTNFISTSNHQSSFYLKILRGFQSFVCQCFKVQKCPLGELERNIDFQAQAHSGKS